MAGLRLRWTRDFGELCSQAGCCAYRADTASGLAWPGQRHPAWPEVTIRVNVVQEEICRKQSGMDIDREPGRT